MWTMKMKIRRICNFIFLISLFLTVPVFADGPKADYLDIIPAFIISTEKAGPGDAELVRCGLFLDGKTPQEQYEHLTGDIGFPEYGPHDYKPVPGDVVFRKGLLGKVAEMAFIGEDGEIPWKSNYTVVHVEYPSFEQLAFLYLKDEMKLNNAAVSGVLANIYYESFTDPDRNEPGFGICQWKGEKLKAFDAFCEKNGLDRGDLYNQLDYLKADIEQNEQLLYDFLKSAEDSSEDARRCAEEFWSYLCSPANAPAAEETLAVSEDAAAGDTADSVQSSERSLPHAPASAESRATMAESAYWVAYFNY